MAFISYDKSWRGVFFNNVSSKDKVQDFEPNQLKLKLNNTYEER